MKRTPFPPMMTISASLAVSLAVAGSMALAAQDRSTLKVPNGPAFSEFKGYENWQNVAVSQTEMGIKIIAANPAMINSERHPRQWQAVSRGLQDREDRVDLEKERRVALFRDGARYLEIAFIHREGQQEIQGLGRMGIRSVSK
jgi:hypothetical protein